MSSDSNVIRILAVDDHRLIRQGIAGLVATQSDMRVIAEATNGREALKEFRAHRPDITLMDMQMPEMTGLDARIIVLIGFGRISAERRRAQCEQKQREGARGSLMWIHVWC